MKLGQTLDPRTQDAPNLELRLDDGHGWRRLLDSSARLEIWTEQGELLAKLSTRRVKAILDHYLLGSQIFFGLSRELSLDISETFDLTPADRLPAVEPGAWRSPVPAVVTQAWLKGSPIPDQVTQQQRAKARRARPRARKGGPA